MEPLREKAFLGQEFLTWLWYASEEEESLELADGTEVSVLVGDRLVLGPIPGADGARITVRGESANLAEAREGLRRGKMVESLRLGLESRGQEFWLTLDALDLGVRSLKLPQTGDGEDEEKTGREGLILERIHLIQTVLEGLEGLYELYTSRRLDWGGEKGLGKAMKAWALRTD